VADAGIKADMLGTYGGSTGKYSTNLFIGLSCPPYEASTLGPMCSTDGTFDMNDREC